MDPEAIKKILETIDWANPTERTAEGYSVYRVRADVGGSRGLRFANLTCLDSGGHGFIQEGTAASRAEGAGDAQSRKVEGTASSTSIDSYGTEMAHECLEDMAEQFRAGIPYLPRHREGWSAVEWDGQIGITTGAVVMSVASVKNAFDDADRQYVLKTEAELYDKPKADELLTALQRQSIGQSIGGWFVLMDYVWNEETDELVRIIVRRVRLDHLAVTRGPSNPDSADLVAVRSAMDIARTMHRSSLPKGPITVIPASAQPSTRSQHAAIRGNLEKTMTPEEIAAEKRRVAELAAARTAAVEQERARVATLAAEATKAEAEKTERAEFKALMRSIAEGQVALTAAVSARGAAPAGETVPPATGAAATEEERAAAAAAAKPDAARDALQVELDALKLKQAASEAKAMRDATILAETRSHMRTVAMAARTGIRGPAIHIPTKTERDQLFGNMESNGNGAIVDAMRAHIDDTTKVGGERDCTGHLRNLIGSVIATFGHNRSSLMIIRSLFEDHGPMQNRALDFAGHGTIYLQEIVQKEIQNISDYQLGALTALGDKGQDGGTSWIVPQRTPHATKIEYIGEGAATESTGTGQRQLFDFKRGIAKMQVSTFLQRTGSNFLDLFMSEMENKLGDMRDGQDFFTFYGDSANIAPADEFDGLYTWLANGTLPVSQSVTAGAAVTNALTQSAMRQAIDKVKGRARKSDLRIMASQGGARALAALLEGQQRFGDSVEVGAGFRVPTYEGIPIIECSNIADDSLWVPGTKLHGGLTGEVANPSTTLFITNSKHVFNGVLTPLKVARLAETTIQSMDLEACVDHVPVLNNPLGMAVLGGVTPA